MLFLSNLSLHRHSAPSSITTVRLGKRYFQSEQWERNLITDLLHVYSKQVTTVHVNMFSDYLSNLIPLTNLVLECM